MNKVILIILTLLFFQHAGAQVKKLSMGEYVKRTSIYPNPARSFIQLQYRHSTPPPSSLVVYNFLGKKQMEVLQPGGNVFIDLASFRRGLYIFQFRDRNGTILDSGKFQVEK
jgi:hypothetical protein